MSGRAARRVNQTRLQKVKPILVVPERIWNEVRHDMLASRIGGPTEVFAFLFCTRHRDGAFDRYLVKHWLVPTANDYVHQSIGGLTLNQAIHTAILERFVGRGFHIVHVHTHPGHQTPRFSSIDNGNESAYAAALRHLPGRLRLLSGVFNEDMEVGSFRIWPEHSDGSIERVEMERFGLPASRTASSSPELFDRQRIFGSSFQNHLGTLSVALIGCGGIGAPFAEQLARLGVRNWTLVDDDRLEVTNLHRMPFATRRMARRRHLKTDYTASLIRRFWGQDAHIRTLALPVETERVQRRLARADLIVVATDNHHSRLVAQQIALRYLKPVLCLGTHIEKCADQDHPRVFARVTFPPLGGGWCLPCANVIDLDQASKEVADPATRGRLKERGYLDGVPAPAVYWLNSMCASMGAGLVHGILAGFTDSTSGIDWVFDLAMSQWLQIDHGVTPDCFFCSSDGMLAQSDVPPVH